jgi:hypothetical protein
LVELVCLLLAQPLCFQAGSSDPAFFLCAAEALAHALDAGGTLKAAIATMHPPIWRELAMSEDEAQALLKDIEQSLKEFSAAMSA